jgi:hypothetical protein
VPLDRENEEHASGARVARLASLHASRASPGRVVKEPERWRWFASELPYHTRSRAVERRATRIHGASGSRALGKHLDVEASNGSKPKAALGG